VGSLPVEIGSLASLPLHRRGRRIADRRSKYSSCFVRRLSKSNPKLRDELAYLRQSSISARAPSPAVKCHRYKCCLEMKSTRRAACRSQMYMQVRTNLSPLVPLPRSARQNRNIRNELDQLLIVTSSCSFVSHAIQTGSSINSGIRRSYVASSRHVLNCPAI
jgi:hypothetical protein